MHRIVLPLVAVCGLLLLSAGARAGSITQFTDRPTFDAAVGPTVVEDFTNTSHFPISTGILNSSTNLPSIGITPGVILPGVTYSAPVTGNGIEFNIDAGGGFVGGFLDSLVNRPPLTATFDSRMSAFGFDTNGLIGGTTQSLVINFSSGPSATLALTLPSDDSLHFFGFQSSAQDIVSINLSGDSPTFGFALDNFTYGNVSATPEPATITLLGLSLVGMCGFGWRRQRHAPRS